MVNVANLTEVKIVGMPMGEIIFFKLIGVGKPVHWLDGTIP